MRGGLATLFVLVAVHVHVYASQASDDSLQSIDDVAPWCKLEAGNADEVSEVETSGVYPSLVISTLNMMQPMDVLDEWEFLEELSFCFESIGSIPLYKLALVGHGITRLPINFDLVAQNAEIIMLDGNALESFDHFPSSLPRLKSLMLSRNNIASIPKHLHNSFPALQRLELNQNRIDSLDHLPSCGHLTTLYLDDNPISDFSSCSSKFPRLSKLSIRGTSKISLPSIDSIAKACPAGVRIVATSFHQPSVNTRPDEFQTRSQSVHKQQRIESVFQSICRVKSTSPGYRSVLDLSKPHFDRISSLGHLSNSERLRCIMNCFAHIFSRSDIPSSLLLSGHGFQELPFDFSQDYTSSLISLLLRNAIEIDLSDNNLGNIDDLRAYVLDRVPNSQMTNRPSLVREAKASFFRPNPGMIPLPRLHIDLSHNPLIEPIAVRTYLTSKSIDVSLDIHGISSDKCKVVNGLLDISGSTGESAVPLMHYEAFIKYCLREVDMRGLFPSILDISSTELASFPTIPPSLLGQLDALICQNNRLTVVPELLSGLVLLPGLPYREPKMILDLQGNPLTNPRSLNIQLQKAGVSVLTSLLSDLPVDYCRVNSRGVLDFSKVAALHGRPTEEIIPCIEFCFDFLYDSKVFPIEINLSDLGLVTLPSLMSPRPSGIDKPGFTVAFLSELETLDLSNNRLVSVDKEIPGVTNVLHELHGAGEHSWRGKPSRFLQLVLTGNPEIRKMRSKLSAQLIYLKALPVF